MDGDKAVQAVQLVQLDEYYYSLDETETRQSVWNQKLQHHGPYASDHHAVRDSNQKEECIPPEGVVCVMLVGLCSGISSMA